jgi:glycosyltransferase involved in cell wall biosynthesis
MRVLLLSAYDAPSHAHWHRCLRAGIPDWHWQLLTLPPRHFSWRIRGNPLGWFPARAELLSAGYDLVLATSMVDLATLRGLVPALAATPAVLYFHENQFAYPPGESRHGLLEAQMVSLYASLSADLLLFNSQWNRDSFLSGCSALLEGFPDAVSPGVVETLTERSQVLPVPLPELPDARPRAATGRPLQLLWNHRWEHDKGPELLLELAGALVEKKECSFTLHVVGQQFRRRPPEFERLRTLLDEAGALGSWGYRADRGAYLDLLGSCDVVLSTAHHDFQGLAVLEACAVGCTPLLPDRLAYREYAGSGFRYVGIDDAVERIIGWARLRDHGEPLPRLDVAAFSAAALLPRYRQALHSQAAGN